MCIFHSIREEVWPETSVSNLNGIDAGHLLLGGGDQNPRRAIYHQPLTGTRWGNERGYCSDHRESSGYLYSGTVGLQLLLSDCRPLLRASPWRNECVVHDHDDDRSKSPLCSSPPTHTQPTSCQSFLTPMAAGAQATRQGWRWSYRTMGIFNAVIFVLFIVFYEESKYTPTIEGVTPTARPTDGAQQIPADESGNKSLVKAATRAEEHSISGPPLDHIIPMKTWAQRLSLVTYTQEPIWPYFYRPIEILFTFPAVLCCGLQYACGVIWLTILSSVIALVFPLPPYEFTPEQIGYMSVGPFIGNLIGSFYGGFLGDWSIKYFSGRNSGYYEPEMRLYILHLPAVALCGGLIMFGVTIDRVCLPNHRSLLLSVELTSHRVCTGFYPVSLEPSLASGSAVSATHV